MFTKVEQCSWIKIEVARDCSTQEHFQGLHEARGNSVLPYHRVTWWVKAFQGGRDAVQDNLHTVNSLLPLWMLITDELCVSQQWKSEYITKLCSTFCMTFWVTTNLKHVGYPMNFPRCNNGTAKQSHRPWTGTKGSVTFLDESSLWTKPRLAHTN